MLSSTQHSMTLGVIGSNDNFHLKIVAKYFYPKNFGATLWSPWATCLPNFLTIAFDSKFCIYCYKSSPPRRRVNRSTKLATQ